MRPQRRRTSAAAGVLFLAVSLALAIDVATHNHAFDDASSQEAAPSAPLRGAASARRGSVRATYALGRQPRPDAARFDERLATLRPRGGSVVAEAPAGGLLAARLLRHVEVKGSHRRPHLNLPMVESLDGSLPAGDPRSFQHATLPNGLEMVNIEDSNTTMFAIAVAVTAGSFYDSLEATRNSTFLGLAHLTEHSLFLGTQSFPEKSGFDEFLARHGGATNAYTMEEHTIYYASAAHGAYHELIHRFSDMLSKPLLNASSIWAEVDAVNSEHAKNLQSADSQMVRLLKSLADKGSPVHNFRTGNRKTLQMANQSDLQRAIRRYFDRNYCAPRMRVVTFGPQSLATQFKEVEKWFGALHRRGSAGECSPHPRKFSHPKPFPQRHLGNFVRVEGNSPKLLMMFPFENLAPSLASHPLTYIRYHMLYDAPGSLKRRLMDEMELAEAVDMWSEDNSAGTIVWVGALLLEKGLRHPDAAIQAILDFFADLRRHGVDEEVLASLAHADQLQWNWGPLQQSTDLAAGVAQELTMLPARQRKDCEVMTRPSPESIAHLLQGLHAERMNVCVMDAKAAKDFGTATPAVGSPDFNGGASSQTGALGVHIVEYFDVRYTMQPLRDRFPNLRSGVDGDLVSAGGPRPPIERQRQFQSDVGYLAADSLSHGVQRGSSEEVSKGSTTQRSHLPQHGGVGMLAATKVSSWPEMPRLLPQPAADGVPKLDIMRFHMPGPVEYLPGNVTMALATARRGQGALGKRWGVPPHILLGVEGAGSAHRAEVYFRLGWALPRPRVRSSFSLLRPRGSVIQGAENIALLKVGALMFSHQVQQALGDMAFSGIAWSIDITESGIWIEIEAWADTFHASALRVLSEWKWSIDTSNLRVFASALEEAVMMYTSSPKEAVLQAAEDVVILTTLGAHTNAELLAATSALATRKLLTPNATAQAFEVALRGPFAAFGLVMGALDEKAAKRVSKHILGAIPGDISLDARDPDVEWIKRVVRTGRPVEVRRASPRVRDNNYVMYMRVFVGVPSIRHRVLLSMIGDMLFQIAFTELRTVRQLGYNVGASVSLDSNVMFVSCFVQGQALPPDELEAQCENVLSRAVPEEIAKMTDSVFEARRSAFADELIQRSTSPKSETDFFKTPLALGYCSNLHDKLLDYLQTTASKELMLEAWNEAMLPKAGVRNKITIKYWPWGADVPKPPTEVALSAAMGKIGLPQDAIDRVVREKRATLLLRDATSASRAEIMRGGGCVFPMDVICDVGPSTLDLCERADVVGPFNMSAMSATDAVAADAHDLAAGRATHGASAARSPRRDASHRHAGLALLRIEGRHTGRHPLTFLGSGGPLDAGEG